MHTSLRRKSSTQGAVPLRESTRRMAWPMVIALLCVLTSGCFDVKDELTINADGSGSVKIETRAGAFNMSSAMGMGMASEMGGIVIYPPSSEPEAKQFFPGSDFTVKTQQKREGQTTITTIQADFKDINALLNSPYGKAHALSLRTEGGALILKGLLGTEALARFADMKGEYAMAFQMAASAAGSQKTNDTRIEFRVTLPNTTTAGNGTNQGKTSAWLVDRKDFKDNAEFATKLGVPFETRCSAEGVKFTAETPVRLPLQNFAELVAPTATSKGPTIDTGKVSTAAKFVPYALTVTRSLDLSGEGGARENSATLNGAVVVPKEFKPQRWGQLKLDEVVDSKGNDLKLEDSESGRSYDEPDYESMLGGFGEEDGDAVTNSPDFRKMVTFHFKSPEWSVKQITRIKGSMDMQYFGGATHLIKLTNAVPSSSISKNMMGIMERSGGGGSKTFSDAKLEELGLSLSLKGAMTEGGMTTLMVKAEGTKATLTDAQVFDRAGKTWPTIFQGGDNPFSGMFDGGGSEGVSCTLIVAGEPEPPLSLAFLASGGGATVNVPIQVENVPLGGK